MGGSRIFSDFAARTQRAFSLAQPPLSRHDSAIYTIQLFNRALPDSSRNHGAYSNRFRTLRFISPSLSITWKPGFRSPAHIILIVVSSEPGGVAGSCSLELRRGRASARARGDLLAHFRTAQAHLAGLLPVRKSGYSFPFPLIAQISTYPRAVSRFYLCHAGLQFV